MANWKLAGLPKYLPRGAARQVLAHCEQTTAAGRRNYAILLLLARLGLRGAEVVDLRLEDIDWRKGEITVCAKKGGAGVRFALPADVGQAMAAYLQKGRPCCSCRNVFVRLYAPYGRWPIPSSTPCLRNISTRLKMHPSTTLDRTRASSASCGMVPTTS